MALSDGLRKLLLKLQRGQDELATAIENAAGAGDSFSLKFAKIWEQQNEGVAAGATESTAFASQRALTNLSDPDSIGITLAEGKKFTVPAGKFKLDIRAPFFQTTVCQLRLYDVTNSASVKFGQTNYSGSGDATQCIAHCSAIVDNAVPTQYQIDYHAGLVVATNGLGVPTSGITVSGHKEIYCEVDVLQYG